MDLEQLLAVQELDTRITQLRHRLANDPVHAELAAAEQALAGIERDELDLFGRRETVRRELKRLEDEAASTEAKIERVEGQLYGGAVTAPKELEALQHEIGTLKDILSGIEDGELEQMELLDPLEAAAADLAEAKRAASALVEQRRGDVTVMEAEVGAELDDVSARRADLAGSVPADLLAAYERSGAARLAAGGRCEGCHLTLPSAEYAAIKRAPADEIHPCPECGRILVR